METNSDLEDFLAAQTVSQRWDAARRLMASKRLQSLATNQTFAQAFASLGTIALEGNPLDRLLAIDLLVRIPAAAKGIQGSATKLLSVALQYPLPPAWAVSDTTGLPTGAKPAEVRENVAQALTWATGDWVTQYVVDSLAREDRSQRCRTELCRQLLARNKAAGSWFRALSREPWQEILPDSAPSDARLARLRDLASALTELIRAKRTSVLLTPEDGTALAALVRSVARMPAREDPGPRLAAAASEVVRLLDEMIAAEFTLAMEAQSYEVLETIQGWWRAHPFPQDLTVDLGHIERRLHSAIALRARTGQRSDSLAARLRQAVGSGGRAAEVLTSIADANTGLAVEVDDWLRGHVRSNSATAMAASMLLGATAAGDFVAAFAPLVLDCYEAKARSSRQDADVLRLCNRVDAIAVSLGLSVAGREGEVTEYRPAVHVTSDGIPPPDTSVRIIRPMVIRDRPGGAPDVVVRAVVVSA